MKRRHYLGKEEKWVLSQRFGGLRNFLRSLTFEPLITKEARLSWDHSGKPLELGNLAGQVTKVPSWGLPQPNASRRRCRHLPSIRKCLFLRRFTKGWHTLESQPSGINTRALADPHNQVWYVSSHSQPCSRCLSLIISGTNKPLIKRRGENEVRFLRQQEQLGVAVSKLDSATKFV